MKGAAEVLEAKSAAARAQLDDEVHGLFEAGRKALRERRVDDAVATLREAHARAPAHGRIRSFLGLAIASADRRAFDEARGLCEEAVRQEFFNPDLYDNLARVYLRFDRRSEALRYLRRGQMIAPGHAGISETLASLGRRRLPIVPFLPRRHALNRMLGTARSRLADAFSRA